MFDRLRAIWPAPCRLPARNPLGRIARKRLEILQNAMGW